MPVFSVGSGCGNEAHPEEHERREFLGPSEGVAKNVPGEYLNSHRATQDPEGDSGDQFAGFEQTSKE
jgi:hypothetical protein